MHIGELEQYFVAVAKRMVGCDLEAETGGWRASPITGQTVGGRGCR